MAAVNAIPTGFHSVTASLVVKNAPSMIEFYKKAFGAKEIERFEGPDGNIMHAVIQIGDSRIMLGEENAEMGCVSPKTQQCKCFSLNLYVENSDTVFNQALNAGGTAEQGVTEMFWGDRGGMITDPSGHRWWVATRKEDLTKKQIQRRAEEFFASMAKSN